MKANLQNSGVNIKLPEFNNATTENGVNCSDLDKMLKFDSIKDFNESIEAVTKLSPTLSAYAACGS